MYGDGTAREVHTLFNQQNRQVDKKELDSLMPGLICATSDTFTENKKLILKLCADSKNCDYEEDKKKIERFSKEILKATGDRR